MAAEKSKPKEEHSAKTESIWDISKDKIKESRSIEIYTFWNAVYAVTRRIFVAFLFVGIISTAVISKGAFLILTWNLFTPYDKSSDNKLKSIDGHLRYSTKETRLSGEKSGTDVSYIRALLVMIVTPYCLKVVFYFLRLVFKKQKCSKEMCFALVAVLITSTIHSVSLSIFAFSLMPALDPFSGVWFTCSVICAPYLLARIINKYAGCGLVKNKREKHPEEGTNHAPDTSDCGPVQNKREKHPEEGTNHAPDTSVVGGLLFIASVVTWTSFIWRTDDPTTSTAQNVLFCCVPVFMSISSFENFLPFHKDDKSTKKSKKDGKSNEESNKNDKSTKKSKNDGERNQESNKKDKRTKKSKNDGESNEESNKNDKRTKKSKNDGESNEESNKNDKRTKKSKKVNKCDKWCTWKMFKYKFCRLKNDIYTYRYYIYLVENLWKLLCTFVTVLGIFGAGCEDVGLCTRVLLGIEPQATARLTNDLGSTLLYHGSECTRATPFYVAIVGICSSFMCHRLCVAGIQIVEHFKCFYLPVVSSPLFAFGIGMLITRFALDDATMCMFPFPSWDGDVHVWWGIIQIPGILFYISLILTTSFLWIHKPERMAKEDKIFFKPMYCGALFESSVLCNRWFDDQKSEKKTETSKKETSVIYMCATMWHETEKEMEQLLKSIFRMDVNQIVRRVIGKTETNFEAHIFFDDAFQTDSPGEYVTTFIKEIEHTARRFYRNDTLSLKCTTITTPYGRRLEYELEGKNNLVVHLKDKTKIRNKKRWSQVMYMYYLLSYRVLKYYRPKKSKKTKKETKTKYELEEAKKKFIFEKTKNTFILALDGDVDFQPNAVYQLLDRMKNEDVGAACGRIHPKGDGEDRWLCTLLLKQGKKIEYCAASDAHTFAPQGFTEFYKQRRRWTPSTMLNIMEILADWKEITRNNNFVSSFYILLQLLWFVSSVLTPAALLLMVSGAINLAYPALSLHASFLINLGVIVVFVIVCFFTSEKIQLNVAVAFSILYALVMMLVIVGLIRQSQEQGLCSLTPVFTLFVAGIFVIAAICHPSEIGCLFYGPLFFVAIPSMSMLMMFYSIINMNVVSWGTRESIEKKEQGEKNVKSKYGLLGRIRMSCNCCAGKNEIPEKDTVVIDMLNALSTRIKVFEETFPKEGKKKESRLTEDRTSHKNNAEEIEPDTRSQTTVSKLDVGICKDNKLDEKEEEFWKWLIDEYLKPLEKINEDAGKDSQAKDQHKKRDIQKLRKYRNSICLAFLLSNALFVTIIFFLQIANYETEGKISVQLPCPGERHITVEPIGMAFTIVFGILLVIQFLCMLLHRWKTLLQIYSSTDSSIKNMEELLMESCKEYYEAKSKNMSKESELQPVENRIHDALKYMKDKVDKELKAREDKTCCSRCQRKCQRRCQRLCQRMCKTEEDEEDKMTVLSREIKTMSEKRLRKMNDWLNKIDSQNPNNDNTESKFKYGPSTSTYGLTQTLDVAKKSAKDDSRNQKQTRLMKITIEPNDSQKTNTDNSTTSNESGPSTGTYGTTQNSNDNIKPAERNSRNIKQAWPGMDEGNGLKNPDNGNMDTSYRYGPSTRTYGSKDDPYVDRNPSESDSKKQRHALREDSNLTDVDN